VVASVVVAGPPQAGNVASGTGATGTVIEAVCGPNGYVETFDATFEQHCNGGDGKAVIYGEATRSRCRVPS
jgi:hypothetical protein